MTLGKDIDSDNIYSNCLALYLCDSWAGILNFMPLSVCASAPIPSKNFQRGIGRNIQGMYRISFLGLSEAVQRLAMVGEELDHGVGPANVSAMSSPTGDYKRAIVGDLLQPPVVFRAGGIVLQLHHLGVGGPEREDVQHVEAVEFMTDAEALYPPERGIELLFVGRGRVEADPHAGLLRHEIVPAVLQDIPVFPVRREYAFIEHG